MNLTKFTQKSIQAVERCEKLAYEYGNQEIEEEHLLYSLLTIDDSLILKLVEKMEIQKEYFVNRVEQGLSKRTKVQGGQIFVGQDLNKVLISAEDEAKALGDEYVSVEHLFLAMLKHPNREIKEIFREFGITRERFLQALSTVRGYLFVFFVYSLYCSYFSVKDSSSPFFAPIYVFLPIYIIVIFYLHYSIINSIYCSHTYFF